MTADHDLLTKATQCLRVDLKELWRWMTGDQCEVLNHLEYNTALGRNLKKSKLSIIKLSAPQQKTVAVDESGELAGIQFSSVDIQVIFLHLCCSTRQSRCPVNGSAFIPAVFDQGFCLLNDS